MATNWKLINSRDLYVVLIWGNRIILIHKQCDYCSLYNCYISCRSNCMLAHVHCKSLYDKHNGIRYFLKVIIYVIYIICIFVYPANTICFFFNLVYVKCVCKTIENTAYSKLILCMYLFLLLNVLLFSVSSFKNYCS